MVKTSESLSNGQRTRGPDPAAAVVVTCTRLRRRYGATPALDGVDLGVRRGELLAVLGPSGCGKTTLLRLIAGFERPDGGSVAIDGTTVAGARAAPSERGSGARAAPSERGSANVFVPPERRRVGIVVQDHALFPHLTVAGNTAYGLARRDPDRGARVAEVLELVGLGDLGHRYPAELSGGQQQRVALARALAPRPSVVLLDEPFANLDAALRNRLRMEVRQILDAAGATVVLVTHDQEEALSLADRIAVMDAGRVLQVGAPDEIYRRPADPFVARFVGESAVVAARSDGHELETPLGRLAVDGAAPPPGAAMAVVRPDALRLTADVNGTGCVVGSAYYGHDQLVEVAVNGDLVLHARLGSQRRFAPGERVSVDVDGGVVAFPA